MVNFFKTLALGILIIALVISLNDSIAYEGERNTSDLNVYKIDPSLLNSFDVVKKGTTFKLMLLNDVYAKENKKNRNIIFETLMEDDRGFKVSGLINMLSQNGRLSKSSSVGFSTNRLYLDDGQEINLSASSPVFTGTHPPHANTSAIGLAQTITRLSIAGGPITLGASFGISFLASGLLSAYKNGIRDFFWGGLDGTGLGFIEKILRKQPELSFGSESLIPFTLSEDLKISRGIQGEKLEKINLSNTEALEKIQQLLRRGDLTGALELSIKTGQKEKYEEIIRKISSL